MTQRFLVTGITGLLGGWLLRTRPGDAEVVGMSRRPDAEPGDGATEILAADLRDRSSTERALRAALPATVIHAAYALERESIVDATRSVVAAARAVGAEVVLISTDAVFSGDGTPRDEHAQPDPVSDYGRWKAAAEDSLDPGGTVVRLPLITSVDPDDSCVAAIRACTSGAEPATWFTDEFRQPARAEELAAAIWQIALLREDDRSGVWHLPGPERLSRHQIAQRAAARLGLPETAAPGAPTPPGLSRPRDLFLYGRRAESAIGWSPSPVLT